MTIRIMRGHVLDKLNELPDESVHCVVTTRSVSLRPRALDLFCGAGGASMGLHRAGFDITGIDNQELRAIAMRRLKERRP